MEQSHSVLQKCHVHMCGRAVHFSESVARSLGVSETLVTSRATSLHCLTFVISILVETAKYFTKTLTPRQHWNTSKHSSISTMGRIILFIWFFFQMKILIQCRWLETPLHWPRETYGKWIKSICFLSRGEIFQGTHSMISEIDKVRTKANMKG